MACPIGVREAIDRMYVCVLRHKDPVEVTEAISFFMERVRENHLVLDAVVESMTLLVLFAVENRADSALRAIIKYPNMGFDVCVMLAFPSASKIMEKAVRLAHSRNQTNTLNILALAGHTMYFYDYTINMGKKTKNAKSTTVQSSSSNQQQAPMVQCSAVQSPDPLDALVDIAREHQGDLVAVESIQNTRNETPVPVETNNNADQSSFATTADTDSVNELLHNSNADDDDSATGNDLSSGTNESRGNGRGNVDVVEQQPTSVVVSSVAPDTDHAAEIQDVERINDVEQQPTSVVVSSVASDTDHAAEIQDVERINDVEQQPTSAVVPVAPDTDHVAEIQDDECIDNAIDNDKRPSTPEALLYTNQPVCEEADTGRENQTVSDDVKPSDREDMTMTTSDDGGDGAEAVVDVSTSPVKRKRRRQTMNELMMEEANAFLAQSARFTSRRRA